MTAQILGISNFIVDKKNLPAAQSVNVLVIHQLNSMKIAKWLLPSFFAFFLFTFPVQAQSLEEFEEKVTEFTLDNGLTFIVIERPVAPVVSFATFVDVGAVDEPVGKTGIAHIFEHMAFKGTDYIGTNDWEAERQVLDRMDDAYQTWLQEKNRPQPDSARLDQLWTNFEELQEESKQYVENNEFTQIIERNGGTGINAGTGADQTVYFYNLPENRMELWFSLESDRFKNPVLREFYVEKEVVREERRSRTDSNPAGRLIEEFLSVAYTAHPYGRPIIGWNSDITATTMEDARDFYQTYYVPSNITIGIAGDVDPEEVKSFAESYFGGLEEGPEPPAVFTEEPEQRGERRFVIEEETQPYFIVGYHTVSQSHPDWESLQLLSAILSDGRTSRLYRKMVDEEQTALGVQAFNGFPGNKYPSMFVTLSIPNQGVELEIIEESILQEIEQLKDGDISEEELQRAKTNARADLVKSLDSNSGLAQQTASAEAQTGDWRSVFTRIDKLEEVTAEDIQRVAQTYLTKRNRTIGKIINQEQKDLTDAD